MVRGTKPPLFKPEGIGVNAEVPRDSSFKEKLILV